MTYSVAPSAPPGRSINFKYGCPICYPSRSDLLGTEEKKEELCQLADSIIYKGAVVDLDRPQALGAVDNFFIDFLKGAVTINIDLDEGDSATVEIDTLATTYIKYKKEYIASLNPQLGENLRKTTAREEAEKISEIFFHLYNRYEKEQRLDPDSPNCNFLNNTVGSIVPGFKERRKYDRVEAMSLSDLEGEAGEKFKKFMQTLPSSILQSKNAIPFLQEGLNLKNSKADKILYLKQVLFFLTFQEVFKNSLRCMLTDLSVSKGMQYTSSTYSYEADHKYQDKMRRIQETLSKLPVNDVLVLIPLACRASFLELSKCDDPNDPFRFETDVIEERNRARTADIAFKKVLEHSFKKNINSFSVPSAHLNDEALFSIDRVLMGISGLAISSGPSGRFPMHEHRTIYYSRSDLTNIKPVTDHLPVEFFMSGAQFYTENDYTWVEERCLAYLLKMIGEVSHHDLDNIKAQIHKARQAVDKADVEILIKEKPQNQYVLRDSAIKKLHSLCKQAKMDAGLAPSLGATSSRFKRLAL